MDISNISSINSYLAIQSTTALQSTTRVNSVNSKQTVAEVANQAGVANQIDTNPQLNANQQDLLRDLNNRIAENNTLNLEVSLDINILKANVGSLLSHSLLQPSSDVFSNTLTNLLTPNTTSSNTDEISTNLQERLISAAFSSNLDYNGLFGDSDSSNNSLISDLFYPSSRNLNGGNQLLLDFLVGELGTPAEDAIEIINIFQIQPFQAVA